MSDDLTPTSKRIDPAYIEELLDSMEPDAAAACLKMIDWLAERPQDAPKLSQAEMMKMVEETRLEIIRRRLGGVVGKILPFERSQ
jgi:hypothetical protein